MMEAAFARYPGVAVAISAQTYLAPFYATLDFARASPEYDDAGVHHVDMVKRGRVTGP